MIEFTAKAYRLKYRLLSGLDVRRMEAFGNGAVVELVTRDVNNPQFSLTCKMREAEIELFNKCLAAAVQHWFIS
ncbi:MAG: hypothetical protein ACJ8AW_39410 [Rhodopila sp.]